MADRSAGGVKLTSRFDRALVHAAQVHNGQKRKGTNIPYVSHLLAVAAQASRDSMAITDAPRSRIIAGPPPYLSSSRTRAGG